jgi:hypothetical protein
MLRFTPKGWKLAERAQVTNGNLTAAVQAFYLAKIIRKVNKCESLEISVKHNFSLKNLLN